MSGLDPGAPHVPELLPDPARSSSSKKLALDGAVFHSIRNRLHAMFPAAVAAYRHFLAKLLARFVPHRPSWVLPSHYAQCAPPSVFGRRNSRPSVHQFLIGQYTVVSAVEFMTTWTHIRALSAGC